MLPVTLVTGACSAIFSGSQTDASGQLIFNIRELTDLLGAVSPLNPDDQSMDGVTPQPQPPLMIPDSSDDDPNRPIQEPVIQFIDIPRVAVNSEDLPDGPRHYLLGTVPIGAPSPLITNEALIESIRFAGGVAECFVLRQRVDWEAFRPGGTGQAVFTNNIFNLLDTARASGFTASIIELDPVVDRINIGPLPPALQGKTFADPDIREAMKRQAEVVALVGRPTYLSLAIEINGYFEANPDDFANFVSLHKEIYEELKPLVPEVQFMASFNLESIQGRLSRITKFGNHPPQWFLIDQFEPQLDAVGFSTLPFPVFYEPLQMPTDYISRIQDFTDRPIVLSEIGWTTAAESNSNEQLQLDYLSLMMRQAERTPNLRVMAWTIMFDAIDGSIFDLFPEFKFLGLLTANGIPKPAFTVWGRRFEQGVDPPFPPEIQAALDEHEARKQAPVAGEDSPMTKTDPKTDSDETTESIAP